MAENSFEDIISKISSNPELLNKISSTVKDGTGDIGSALSNVIGILSESDDIKSVMKDDDKKNGEKEPILDTSLDVLQKKDDKTGIEGILFSFCQVIIKNSPLLIALKPYLCKEKQDMIDNVVKLSRLSTIINLAK